MQLFKIMTPDIQGKVIYLIKRLHSRVYVRSRIPKVLDRWRARGQRDAVFIWIPKTAGTSLHDTLNCPKIIIPEEVNWRFCGRGMVTFGHMDYHALVEKGWIPGRFHTSAFKFAFARNPFSRTVSLYFYLRGKRFPVEWSFSNFCEHLKSGRIESIGLYNSIGIGQCNPQVKWLENIDLDFLGRFETLSEDLTTIRKRLGLMEVRVPQLNKSTKQDYRELYDERTVDIVMDLYSRDFDELGYCMDLSATGAESIIRRSN